MLVSEAITEAEAILPGEPVADGDDPRWQAILRVAEFIESEPEPVWQFIRAWGAHPQEDLRTAIATCLLEHLLEHHFEKFFPAVVERSIAQSLFGDTFLRCWKFGQAEEPENSRRFDELAQRLIRRP